MLNGSTARSRLLLVAIVERGQQRPAVRDSPAGAGAQRRGADGPGFIDRRWSGGRRRVGCERAAAIRGAEDRLPRLCLHRDSNAVHEKEREGGSRFEARRGYAVPAEEGRAGEERIHLQGGVKMRCEEQV